MVAGFYVRLARALPILVLAIFDIRSIIDQ